MHTRVRHMATHTAVRVPACVRARAAWCTFFREQSDPDCSAGKHQCPTSASMSPPFVPRAPPTYLRGRGQTAMESEALLRTHLSVPLSTNAMATMPQLRKKAQLCSKRSAERSQDTNSRFWPVENTKRGQRAEDSQPSHPSSESSAGSA